MLSRPLTDGELRKVFDRVLADCLAGKPACIPMGAGLSRQTQKALAMVLAGTASESAARAELERQLDGSHARADAAEWRDMWDGSL